MQPLCSAPCWRPDKDRDNAETESTCALQIGFDQCVMGKVRGNGDCEWVEDGEWSEGEERREEISEM